MRADLLALTPDDLATLTNRGTVKRATKELDAGTPTCEIRDDADGDLVVTWSDGIVCRFPAAKTLHDAVCSSGFVGISRHIVRSVLAYQAMAQISETSDDLSEVKPETQAILATWDPGEFSDDDLVAQFKKAAIFKARRRFEKGILVELTRGAKPVARFLDEACVVGFPVPGDLRYATADCAESLWPTWVSLAVWAFRQLPADRLAGLLSIQENDLPTPGKVLDELDALFDEFVRDGMSGISETWSHRLTRTEKKLREEGLVWPAELVADLLHQHDMYHEHQARFEPRQLVRHLGEIMARTRAIVHRTRAAPQILIRGGHADRPTDMAGGRMIGVGLGAHPGKGHVTLSAYMQDTRNGNVMAVERTFADPEPESNDEPRSFTRLASTILVRGISLIGLASSHLLLKSGKRMPGGQLILPRGAANMSINPQTFQWEQLNPPFAADSFAQLSQRLDVLPPSYLRPRRRTENLHVVAVTAVEDVRFDSANQRLTAVLRDAQSEMAHLVHPYHSRSHDGFNQLMDTLHKQGDQVRFVCGHVRAMGRNLEICPVSVIVDDGGHRSCIHPWIGDPTKPADSGNEEIASKEPDRSAIECFFEQLENRIADILITGVGQADPAHWREQAEYGHQVGFVRLSRLISDLAESLNARLNTPRWDPNQAVKQVRELCLLVRVAME